ncbi:hypothetical protein TPHA_0F02030 [Tetrapisispora phaffii CBS 4417]|uniref:Uncharacterized protein n=1 Tax=Tetrapisispora phaffii (strain ATCC 24235 / CBS 4417 / NBRC 1672 / NRRL Y-8282 / UCD 70-5) TaxID=1071381 RepID=G8BVA3_TETPH|nr:hypothetical protein TPHA_0F02030 [Tetrapisispora phaffii CBS 4417]CCE63685.1 hypothetical protein TPHA_0F02030 [Tetrapisispora phaffii CBS 4417]
MDEYTFNSDFEKSRSNTPNVDEHLINDNGNNDDELYEQFVRESNALRIREEAQETQQTQEEFQRELEDTIHDILRDIDSGLQNSSNTQHRIVITANTNNNEIIELNNDNLHNVNNHPLNVHNRRSPFEGERRPFLRTFLRNLLVLDYFVILLLFPFSLYNILKSGFSIMTFSENDFVQEMLYYLSDVQVFSENYKSLLIYKEINLGLLGKFHNIMIYYSSPLITTVMSFLKRHAHKVFTNKAINMNFKILIMNVYSKSIKMITLTMYFIYGFGGTIYLLAAGFFFLLCFTISVVRRYKGVHRIISKSVESVSHLPGVF